MKRHIEHKSITTHKDGIVSLRGYILNGSRYPFDAALRGAGWQQYDTSSDAWYFGVWIHLERRLIFTFAEGDTCLEVFPDQATFRAALDHMNSFFEPTPAFITYEETESGFLRTKHYQERP